MATMHPVPGGFIGHTPDTTILVTDQQMIAASAQECQRVRETQRITDPRAQSLADFAEEWDAADAPYDPAYWTQNGGRR